MSLPWKKKAVWSETRRRLLHVVRHDDDRIVALETEDEVFDVGRAGRV